MGRGAGLPAGAACSALKGTLARNTGPEAWPSSLDDAILFFLMQSCSSWEV